MGTPLRIGLAVGIAALGLSACGASSTSQASAEPTDWSVSAPCDQAKGEAAYTAARATGIIVGQDVSRSEGIVILVNARRFRRLGFDGQRRLAARLDCGIAGVGKHVSAIRFREDRSGPDLYAIEAGDLLDLRKSGAAG